MQNTNLQFIELRGLSSDKPVEFNLQPKPDECAQIAAELGVDALRKVRFQGDLRPMGKSGWELRAKLGATVVQPCVVTLAPVTTRIETQAERRYTNAPLPDAAAEMEMPEDENREPIPGKLDLLQVIAETLSLAIPEYPRAPGVALGDAQFTAPGLKPMTDDDAKPLAGLAELKKRMQDKG